MVKDYVAAKQRPLHITHQFSGSIPVLPELLQSVGHALIRASVREWPYGWLHGPTALLFPRSHSPAAINLTVWRQRLILLRSIAWWSAVVTVTTLLGGLWRCVTVLINPCTTFYWPPCLVLQQVGIIVWLSTSNILFTISISSSLCGQMGTMAPPVGIFFIIFIPEAWWPVVILVPQFQVIIFFRVTKIMKVAPSSSSVSIVLRKLLQFIQRPCATPGVKGFPGQVLWAAAPPEKSL